MANIPQYQSGTPEWADTNSHAILEASPDAMLVVNRAGEIVAANLQAEKLFRLRRDQLIGVVVESLLPVRFRERHGQHRENFLANPEAQFMQVPDIFALRSDASELPVDVTLSRLTIGPETFAISAIRDATVRVRMEELKRSEAALRESEERFRSLADTAPVLIWQSGKDKLCTYFNKSWLDFTGRSMEEELGNGWAEGVHSEDLQRCLDTYTQSFDRREKFRMEYRLRRHGGEYRWIIDIGVPRFNQDRSFAGYIGIGVDVTERKRAEEALRESEERLRLALQAGKVYAYEWDVATDAVVRSEEFRSILGSDESGSLTRQQLSAKVHPDDRARFVAAVDNLTPQNPTTQITYRVFRADGSVVWLEKHGRAFFDPQGRMLRMIGMVTDVTERKRSEERLREYEKAVEAVEEMIVVVDREYRILMANRKYAIMRNMAKGQVVGRFVHEVLNKGVFEGVVKPKLDECFQGRVVRYEMKYTYPGLGERDVALSYFPIEGTTGVEGAACILQDITERKRAEEALQESEEKFRCVFRDAGVGMVVVSPEGRFLAANAAFCDCLGYTEEELLEKTVESVTFPEDWPAFSQTVRETLIEGRGFQWFKKRCLHKSGRIVYTESSASLIRSREGDPQYLVGQVLDITERKEAEETLAEMTRKLIEAQEQERARIARELHDDINQRLAMLAVELEQLREHSPELAPENRQRVEQLREETTAISGDVQALSHDLHSSQLEYLGAVAGIRSWCEEFGERQGMQIDCRHDVRNTLPTDIGLCLFRVLQEALHNAAKHSGVKRIEVELVEDLREIHLTIRDLGKGFDIEAARQGRGLGLTSMQERVRLVNGTIEIQSKPMGGTTIHARVPFTSEARPKRLAV